MELYFILIKINECNLYQYGFIKRYCYSDELSLNIHIIHQYLRQYFKGSAISDLNKQLKAFLVTNCYQKNPLALTEPQ